MFAAIVPFIDQATGPNVLARHLRSGYPALTGAHRLGRHGVAGLPVGSRSARHHRVVRPSGQYGPAGGGPAVTTCIFALGAGVAVFNLLGRDLRRHGLPPQLGWVGMLPVVAGVLAVALLWTTPRDLRGLTEMRRIRESLVSHFGSLQRRLYDGRPAAFMRASQPC